MVITTTDRSLASLKEEICDIGRRIYNKGFAAGNDGNISFRLNDKEVLCTPTQISKGFMKPSDLCIVDMEGNQVAGQRKRSSEILLHLTIMKDRPDVHSVSTFKSIALQEKCIGTSRNEIDKKYYCYKYYGSSNNIFAEQIEY